jgi:hypothetical protein
MNPPKRLFPAVGAIILSVVVAGTAYGGPPFVADTFLTLS